MIIIHSLFIFVLVLVLLQRYKKIVKMQRIFEKLSNFAPE